MKVAPRNPVDSNPINGLDKDLALHKDPISANVKKKNQTYWNFRYLEKFLAKLP